MIRTLRTNKIHHGDCLEVMNGIKPGSIDMVLCDPPYGTTRCKWDSVIPLDEMWKRLKIIVKRTAPIVMTCSQPFTSALVMSNIKMFRYCWVWNKITARGHLVAKKVPMKQHEDIAVFYSKAPTYNPQMVKRDKPVTAKEYKRTSIMGGKSSGYGKTYTYAYPKTIQTFGMDKRNGHPTQKPVALFEYLIKTYTNPGDLVLDFAIGSGTTAVACINSGRRFIGIEKEQEYVDLANTRIQNVKRGTISD